MGVLVAEEVAFVPGGALWVLGNVVSAEECEAGEVCGVVEVEIGLVHVVLRRVVGGSHPAHGDFESFLAAVGRTESGRRHDGGDSLLDERILVAADEDGLRGDRVGAFDDAHALGGALDYGLERRVRRRKR